MRTTGSLLGHLLDPRLTQEDEPLIRLAGFIDGFTTAQVHMGVADPAADEFFSWLYGKWERSSEGWQKKLSRELGGDQRSAVEKFQELLAEFVEHKEAVR